MSVIRRVLTGLVLTLTVTSTAVGTAGALTLGATSATNGTPVPCSDSAPTDQLGFNSGTASGISYAVPAGGGAITSWSFNTTGATVGAKYGLLVVSPDGSGQYTVVGSDEETVPSSPPAVQTYTLATPIAVQAGDLIGDVLYSGSSSLDCLLTVSGPVTADTWTGSYADPFDGTLFTTTLGPSASYLANVSANLVQAEDAGITQTSTQSSFTTGTTVALLLSASSTPAASPVKVTDTVPSGLTIDSVVTGSGSCTISGQAITCTGVNAPATIAVIVTASQAGQFTNTAAVTTPQLPDADPNPANNSSSTTLQVTSPVSPTLSTTTVTTTTQTVTAAATIRWSSLTRLPLTEARTVIHDLDLKVGKVTYEHSKSIAKGEVISTSAHSGNLLPVGTTVTIVASSGKPTPKHS